MNKNLVSLTVGEVRRRVMNFHPGDRVEIQVGDEEMPVVATLVKIYPSIVAFKKDDNSTFTADYFTVATKANIIRASGFETYSENMAISDIADAVRNIQK